MTVADTRTGFLRTRPGLTATIIFAGTFIAGFYPSLLALHQRWASLDEAYSHGYLLLALMFYLLATDSDSSRHTLPVPRWLCLTTLTLLSMAWLFLYLAGVGVIAQLTLPLILLAGIGAIAGSVALTRALVPVLLLYLAIPVWDELLTRPLQLLSTHVSAWVVQSVFGIAVGIDGFHVQIPAGTFEIQGGCSGLVFLLSATTLGIAYGQMMLHSRRARIACVVIASLLGVLVNWVRIISLILIGQHSDMRSSLIGEGHLMFGFYVFAGFALIAILAASRFVVPAPLQMPTTRATRDTPRYALPLTLVAMAAGPLLLILFKTSQTLSTQAVTAAQISKLLQVADVDTPSGFTGAVLDRNYRYSGDPSITTHLVYYRHPFGTGKLVSQRNNVLSPAWREQQRDMIETPGVGTTRASRVVDATGASRLVWSWYYIGGKFIASEREARLALLHNALRFRIDGAFVSISTTCLYPDCALSDQLLARHAPDILKAVDDWATRLRERIATQ